LWPSPFGLMTCDFSFFFCKPTLAVTVAMQHLSDERVGLSL
jgi:hypothetical protein